MENASAALNLVHYNNRNKRGYQAKYNTSSYIGAKMKNIAAA